MNNPFSLTFGKEPKSFIEQDEQNLEIIASFKNDNPEAQVCMLTGIRGSGKTVTMTAMESLVLSEEGRAEEVRERLNMPKNAYSVYRERLLKKGLVRPSSYGCLELTLPRFKEFVLRTM